MASPVTVIDPTENILDRWLSRRRLSRLKQVGPGARLKGRADLGGAGDIIIGDRFFLLSRPVRSHIFASAGALVTIGSDVQISYGAAISSRQRIDIGSNTILGPYVVVMDNDFHRVGNRNADGEIAPVSIGANVMIGARVTILRGSVIGDGVRIMSGSMVSGVIPDGATVAGVPARVVSPVVAESRSDLAALVQDVLGLPERPKPGEGPREIASWDSLGALRLLLAIEESYGVSIDEVAMRTANTIADLSAVVEAKLAESR